MQNNHIKTCHIFKLLSVQLIKGSWVAAIGLICVLMGQKAQAQTREGASATNTDLIEILKSDELEIINENDTEIRKVTNGTFRHKGAVMFSNLAVQNRATNVIEAFGNVKIVQGDTITITGDTLYYYGNTRLAIVSGRKVVMKDQKRTLTTKKLEYDMAGGIAYYKVPGKTVDEGDVLTSKEGFYNTRSKEFTYYKNVVLVNQKYTLTTDTLFYNSITKWSDFRGPSKIVNKDGTVLATRGRYNTETSQSEFVTRTTVDNETYTLTADSIAVDGKSNNGVGKGNVVIVAKKDNTILNGDEGFYNKAQGLSKMYGHAFIRNVIADDTLYIRADTLYSYENTVDSTRQLIGNKNVFIYKSDFQGQCDSIYYNTADSIIKFYKKPILWSNATSQMEADTITTFLVNNQVHRMLLMGHSFVITEDTLVKQHNQVKGRTINAYFAEKNALKQVLVDGNGESAYYAVDDKQKMIGLNRVECGKMNLLFVDNKVHKISFIGKPDGRLIPPQKIITTERQLDGFSWRITERPTKAKTTWQVALQ